MIKTLNVVNDKLEKMERDKRRKDLIITELIVSVGNIQQEK